MWTPDVVFDNQVSLERAVSVIKNESDASVEITVLDCSSNDKCHKMGLDGSMSGQKKIFFKQTVKVEVNCPDMSFDNFPFDEQTCNFTLRDLKLEEETENQNGKILKTNESSHFTWDTPQMIEGNNLTSSEYEITLTRASNSGLDNSRSGFQVRLKRKSAVHIYTYFVPCGLMVMVSWVSFAVNVDAVPGRLGLLLTLLLMTINLNNSASNSIPKSNSICPLIGWILTSMAFILIALLEYFVILVLKKFGNKVKLIKRKISFICFLSPSGGNRCRNEQAEREIWS